MGKVTQLIHAIKMLTGLRDNCVSKETTKKKRGMPGHTWGSSGMGTSTITLQLRKHIPEIKTGAKPEHVIVTSA